MYIIGIDIGKNNHEASIVDSKGILIGKSCRFSNTHKGADKLMAHISRLIGDSSCCFGMEATGHYWYSIYSFLKSKGYTIYVINPIQSDSLRSMYIRQTKNDSKDSFLIAQVIRFRQFATTSLADEDLLSLRQLCRYHDSVISARTEIKLRIHTIIDQIFPEFDKLFSSIWRNSSIAILQSYLMPENIAAATILAEIGDIRRFKNTSALVAYAGIDPSVKQSGEFNSIHNHMSKRGSPYLRHAIFLATTTCTFHESPLNEYYKKKRLQGKHHLTAVGAVSNKLTSIIYAILRDGTPYETKKFGA